MQKEYEQNMQKVEEVTGFHNVSKKELNSAVVSGFDLATVTGPLMDEPMQGAVFILENVLIDKEAAEEHEAKQQEGATTNYGAFAGQVMSTIKSLCKRAFLNADPRIVEGVYLCSMQASPETYGNVYSVLNKCRCRVINEDIQDGTNFFLIDALIPLSEGFVFSEQIRKKSCGIAQPQLVFHGFEVNAQHDPLYMPKTIEEMEDHGEGDILVDNMAKVIIEKVRKQKGLVVSKKILMDADKQRTLAKKK